MCRVEVVSPVVISFDQFLCHQLRNFNYLTTNFLQVWCGYTFSFRQNTKFVETYQAGGGYLHAQVCM